MYGMQYAGVAVEYYFLINNKLVKLRGMPWPLHPMRVNNDTFFISLVIYTCEMDHSQLCAETNVMMHRLTFT